MGGLTVHLRSSAAGASHAELTKSFVVGDDVAASLRDLQLLDREYERLVYRMVGRPTVRC